MERTEKIPTHACQSPASYRALLTMALIATGGLASPAVAADPAVSGTNAQAAPPGSSSTFSPSSQTGPTQPTPPVAGPGSGGAAGTTYTINPSPPLQQDPYATADRLKLRGWIVPLPGAADTLDQGLFGARSKLAENGISYFGFSTSTFQDNLLRHGLPLGNQFGPHSRDNQQYAGQLSTYTTADTIFVMYDLNRYGIPDGQIAVSGSLLQTNWQPGDPNGIGIGQLSYYQTLFNRRVEIKAGYLTNNLEFLGTQVGGNIGSGLFGVSAAIPFEEGQNLGSFPTPGVNVKVNIPGNFYTKLGVQRATSPDGLTVERSQNPTSVRWTVPNAGVFVIDETGYRVNAAPGQMSTWIRAAANYTSSRYTDFNNQTRHNPNYGLYLLADRQLIKTGASGDPRTSFQGLYAGFSVMYGPPNFNAFSQYYEARVYGFGLVPGRPFDLLSLVWNRNVFSGTLVDRSRAFGLLAHDNANTYTAAYNIHLFQGTSLNLGASYTDHPTPIVYNRSTGSSLSALANLFVWF